MNERMERINSLVKEEVGIIIQNHFHNQLLGFITVLHADISKNLQSGKIFVSILGEADKEKTIDTLNKSAGYIQKILGSRIRLRYMPKLRFIYDDVIDHSIHVQEVLRKLELEKKQDHDET
ncbi:MAG: 30S ribosome-binding factor RbfA [bacterium]|nr:30S ribosome-binding factor RbfA [bacterium]